jgi:hypothetical protein
VQLEHLDLARDRERGGAGEPGFAEQPRAQRQPARAGAAAVVGDGNAEPAEIDVEPAHGCEWPTAAPR